MFVPIHSIGAKQELFPVVSQVPAAPLFNERDTTVVYFGQIRPNKGLEAYLDLAAQSIELGKRYRFHIMGSISSAHEEYARSLQAKAPPEVRWSFDLPFEENCLRYHATERAIRTPSSEQVRSPMFADAIDHWRRFEPWLGSLINSLGSVLVDYPSIPDELC